MILPTLMTTSIPALPSCGSLPRPLIVLAAAGLSCSFTGAAQAMPGMSDPDCLRPSTAGSATLSSLRLPPGAGTTQLLAQALPASAAAPFPGPTNTRAVSSQLAQAPQSQPACTYDPPLPPAGPVIRGLW